jgi:hypothetical protein
MVVGGNVQGRRLQTFGDDTVERCNGPLAEWQLRGSIVRKRTFRVLGSTWSDPSQKFTQLLLKGCRWRYLLVPIDASNANIPTLCPFQYLIGWDPEQTQVS